MEHASRQFLEEVKQMMDDYVEYLASMGLELDDEGNIVEKYTKELVLEVDDEDE